MKSSLDHPGGRALRLLLCVALGSVACTGELLGDGSGGPRGSVGPAPNGAAVSPAGQDGKPLVQDPTDPGQVARALDPRRESGLERLSKSQYINSVSDVFSSAAAASLELEVDYRSEGFTSIAGRDVAISRSGVRKYEAAARVVAERVVADTALRQTLSGCSPNGAAAVACLASLVGSTGRRLFRRALTADEVKRYVDLGGAAAQAFGDFWQGFKFALTGLLLSPHFLYQVELGVEKDGERLLTDLELATRLSYFLWDTVPDELLLSAAQRGELSSNGSAERARLLADDERLSRGVRAFSEGLLALHRLDDAPQAGQFPEATPELYGSMKEAVQLLTLEVAVQRRASFLSILEPGFAYVDRALAPFYGVSAPVTGFNRVALEPSSGRVGLLTEPGILAATSRPNRTSPTLRGIFVTGLVCYETPPPPANVNATLPDIPQGITRREQLELHMNQPTCAACHRTIDSAGFGLEGFDALGRKRAQDNGVDADSTGAYFETPFDGAAELSRLVSADSRLAACVARKAYMHGLSRVPGESEAALIEPLTERFAASGHDLADLLAGVAESGLFQLAPKPALP